MSIVKIFSDSTSDLPQGWKETYDIGIVPLYVVFQDGTYKDGVDITPEEVYRRVAANGALPKTAAPSPADFMAAFGRSSAAEETSSISVFPLLYPLHIRMPCWLQGNFLKDAFKWSTPRRYAEGLRS